jgi:hypothetical protein
MLSKFFWCASHDFFSLTPTAPQSPLSRGELAVCFAVIFNGNAIITALGDTC